jgi:hypothetical protein
MISIRRTGMKYIDNGSYFTVQCSKADVEAFKTQYPCSGLPSLAIGFQFYKRNGDLVDIFCKRDSATFDGSGLAALSQDAFAYGEKKIS